MGRYIGQDFTQGLFHKQVITPVVSHTEYELDYPVSSASSIQVVCERAVLEPGKDYTIKVLNGKSILKLDAGITLVDTNGDNNISFYVLFLSEKLSIPTSGLQSSEVSRIDALELNKATKQEVDQKIANLLASAPEQLNTLNELALALNNDQNYATTINNRFSVVESDITSLENRSTTNETDIDALELRVSSTETDVTALEAVDVVMNGRATDLENGLSAETTARQNADAALQAEIDAEEVARASGDAATLASATSYTDNEISALKASAPELLNTLNELANALGNDANFAATVTTQLTQLSTDIFTEAADRNIADQALDTRISVLENTTSPTYESLNLETPDQVGVGADPGGLTISKDGATLTSLFGDGGILTTSEDVNKTLLTLKAANSHTANLLEVVDDADVVLAAITPNGEIQSPTISDFSTRIATLENQAGMGNLDGLSDVVVMLPTAGQMLMYNGNTWTNQSLTLSDVASTGDYNDLSNSPLRAIPEAGLPQLTFFYNYAIGDQALSKNTGSSNIAFGPYGLKELLSGSYNITIGTNALSNFESGSYNLAWGQSAGTLLQTGFQNIFIGANSGQSITSGSRNVIIGSNDGQLISNTDDNILLCTGGGSLRVRIDPEGKTGINEFSPNSQLQVTSAADRKGLIVKGAASQTANLFEVQDSSANTLVSIDATGTFIPKRYAENVSNNFASSLSVETGTLNVDTSLSNCVLGALSASVTTWAFANAPTENGRSTSVSLIISGNASYTYGDACTVNGVSVTGGVKWSNGGVTPLATGGTDILSFIIVRDPSGEVKVFGSGATNFV